jgi:hypothetical protein
MSKENKDIETVDEVKESKYWQWIKGDHSGNVVTIKNIDDKWINFNEGGRLAVDLRDEFLQNLDSDIAGEFINNNPTQPKAIKKPSVNNTVKQTSPIRLLLDKQKKLEKIPLGLSFNIKVPSKNIMAILENSFETDELNKELVNFIEDQIDTDEIIKTLKDSVQILIQERYKGV